MFVSFICLMSRTGNGSKKQNHTFRRTRGRRRMTKPKTRRGDSDACILFHVYLHPTSVNLFCSRIAGMFCNQGEQPSNNYNPADTAHSGFAVIGCLFYWKAQITTIVSRKISCPWTCLTTCANGKHFNIPEKK